MSVWVIVLLCKLAQVVLTLTCTGGHGRFLKELDHGRCLVLDVIRALLSLLSIESALKLQLLIGGFMFALLSKEHCIRVCMASLDGAS